MAGDGVLSGPIDLDGPRRPRATYPKVEAVAGLGVSHRPSGLEGIVVGMAHGGVRLRDRWLCALRPAPPGPAGSSSRGSTTPSWWRRSGATTCGWRAWWWRLVGDHPYVDIWQAIKPGAAGISRWPEVPPGRPWKEGVLTALGVDEHPGRFWRRLLGSVGAWTDLEPPLIGAVEQLIDFVTDPAG